MRLLDAIIDLVLEVYCQWNIILVKPNFKSCFEQSSIKFCCKSFTIGSSVGDESIAKCIHSEVDAQNDPNNVLTRVQAMKIIILERGEILRITLLFLKLKKIAVSTAADSALPNFCHRGLRRQSCDATIPNPYRHYRHDVGAHFRD